MNETVQALKAHIAIHVRNVQRSIEFYRKLFGIEPSKVRKGYAKFDVANPALNFTLNEVPFGERGALSHLGIQVASSGDVVSVRDRWIRQGLITRYEMRTECCYALQDKVWVTDPNGYKWEVFVVKVGDTKPELTAAAAAEADACCPSGCCAE